MVCNALKEIYGNSIFFVDMPSFTWDNIEKMVIDENMQPQSSYGNMILPLSHYPNIQTSSAPSSNFIRATADNHYFIDEDHTIEMFIKEHDGCPIVIYLNNGSIYHGEEKFICPTCGVEHPSRIQRHIRFYIDESGLRKLKLKRLS